MQYVLCATSRDQALLIDVDMIDTVGEQQVQESQQEDLL
jgi:hypothetical protein